MIDKTKTTQSSLIDKSQSLYDADYNLWIEETVKKLQAKNYEAVDWENLIDEVATLGRSEKRALKSLLTRLFEHLLKVVYWESEREYNLNHWNGEIQNFRIQILESLKTSPSLKPYLIEVFEECYQDAREIIIKRTGLKPDHFPNEAIATVEEVLDKTWFPSIKQ